MRVEKRPPEPPRPGADPPAGLAAGGAPAPAEAAPTVADVTAPDPAPRLQPGGRGEGTTPGPETPPAEEPPPDDLRPVEIVRRLDEYIVGQDDAKRSVAIALRNRTRRQRLPDELRHEVLPKNILMIGPTGVGKTEIARRLARLTNSPFIKVEATKFTEVGYVGRDVESIIRDLLEQTISEVQSDRMAEAEPRAREMAESRILDNLVESEEQAEARRRTAAHGGRPVSTANGTDAPSGADPAGRELSGHGSSSPRVENGTVDRAALRRHRARRRRLASKLAARELEDRYIDIEVEEPFQPPFEGFVGTGLEEMGVSLSDFFSQLAPPRRRAKRMTVADARSALIQEETDRLIDMDRVYDESIRLVEEDGIVFVDEVDKICGPVSEHGPDVSGEGVQRDLLPILEGSTVHTRYGSVRTDHILFVAAGAFNVAKPSDLIPEFQGRFPIRVELKGLAEADLQRILTEPGNALTKQYTALLGTENVALEFTPEGIRELAHQAFLVNEEDENIGARRLFTVMEKVLETLSFRAEDFAGQTIRVDADFVRSRVADLVRNDDLRRYVL